MGGCTGSSRKVVATQPQFSRRISITPSQFVQFPNGRFSQFYRVGKKLGGGKRQSDWIGAFGEVYMCYHREAAYARAVKILPKVAINDNEKKRFIQEMNALKIMDHPNIVRLYETYSDSKRYYLVTEYFPLSQVRLCTGGELFDRLTRQKFFSEKDAIGIMKQLLSAVAHCHSKNVVHRDLKPENLLLDSDSKDATLKVIDFGTSQIFDSERKLYGSIGTPLYIAPEVLSGFYTEKCDIWSCGVIMYVLLSGSQPFQGSSKTKVFQRICQGAYRLSGPNWRSVSMEAKDLIRNMLVIDPERRYSAVEALNHPWIQNTHEDTVSSEETKELLNNLSQYNAQYKLQQASLTYIVSQLVTSKERDQLEKIFISLDKDKDGKVSKEELMQGFKDYFGDDYPAEYNVNTIMEQIDIDGNGYIDLTEFVIATINKKNLLSQERLMAAFNLFDRDKNGSISADEVKFVLSDGSDIPDEQWNRIISEVDQNGDGEISLDEFLFMMKKLIKD